MTEIIRLAHLEDRAAVEALVEAAYAPYVVRIGRKPGPMLDDYRALIRDARVYVLDDNGLVSGALVLIPEQATMLLDNIAVHPNRQGLGYGRKLLLFAQRLAREAGYDVIRLYTNEAMTENIGFYRRGGFTETHRAEESGFRRVYMSKGLAEVTGKDLLQ